MIAKICVKSTVISAQPKCLQLIDKRGNSIQSLFVTYIVSVRLRLVQIHWKLSQAPTKVIFCVYRLFHLNFLQQLPLVEQYHKVNISST